MDLISTNHPFISSVLSAVDQQIEKVEKEGFSFCEESGQLVVKKNPEKSLPDLEMVKKLYKVLSQALVLYVPEDTFFKQAVRLEAFLKGRKIVSQQHQKQFTNQVQNIHTLFESIATSIQDSCLQIQMNHWNSKLARDCENLLKKPDPLSADDAQLLTDLGIVLFESVRKHMLLLVRDYLAKKIEQEMKKNSLIVYVGTEPSTKRYGVAVIKYIVDNMETTPLLQILNKHQYYVPPDGDFTFEMFQSREPTLAFLKDLKKWSKETTSEKEKLIIQEFVIFRGFSILVNLIASNRDAIFNSNNLSEKQLLNMKKYEKDPLISAKCDTIELEFADVDPRGAEKQWDPTIQQCKTYLRHVLPQSTALYSCIWEKIQRQTGFDQKDWLIPPEEFVNSSNENLQYKNCLQPFDSFLKQMQEMEREIDENMQEEKTKRPVVKKTTKSKRKGKGLVKRAVVLQIPQGVEGKQEEEREQQTVVQVGEEKKMKGKEKKQLAPCLFSGASPFLCFEYSPFIKKWFNNPEEAIHQYRVMHLGAYIQEEKTLFSHRAPLVLDKIALLCGHEYAHHKLQPSLALVCWIDFPKYIYLNEEKVLTLGFQKPFFASEKTSGMEKTVIHRSFMGNVPSSVEMYQEVIRKKKESGEYLQEKMPLEIEQLVGQKAPDGSCITKIEGSGCTIQMQVQDSDCTIFVVV